MLPHKNMGAFLIYLGFVRKGFLAKEALKILVISKKGSKNRY